jgi:hypothetical protein
MLLCGNRSLIPLAFQIRLYINLRRVISRLLGRDSTLLLVSIDSSTRVVYLLDHALPRASKAFRKYGRICLL